jgi:hypothetical protein
MHFEFIIKYIHISKLRMITTVSKVKTKIITNITESSGGRFVILVIIMSRPSKLT